MDSNPDLEGKMNDEVFTCECGYCGEFFESLQEDDTVCPHCAMVSYHHA